MSTQHGWNRRSGLSLWNRGGKTNEIIRSSPSRWNKMDRIIDGFRNQNALCDLLDIWHSCALLESAGLVDPYEICVTFLGPTQPTTAAAATSFHIFHSSRQKGNFFPEDVMMLMQQTQCLLYLKLYRYDSWSIQSWLAKGLSPPATIAVWSTSETKTSKHGGTWWAIDLADMHPFQNLKFDWSLHQQKETGT